MKTIGSELKGFLKVFKIDSKYAFLLQHYENHENDMLKFSKKKKGNLIEDFLSSDCLLINVPLEGNMDLMTLVYLDSLNNYDAFIEGVINVSTPSLLRYHHLFKPWLSQTDSSIDLDVVLKRAQYLCYKEALTHIKNEFVKYFINRRGELDF